MYKKIKCSGQRGTCQNSIKELDSLSFDDIAKKHAWQKIANSYVCTECQEKQNSRRNEKSYKKTYSRENVKDAE